MEQKKFVVLVGPSGCGKTAIMEYLTTHYSGVYEIVSSLTTRKPRSGACENNYIFLNETEF